MLNREKLVNIMLFMQRVADCKLLNDTKEVMAFAETFTAVNAEIQELDAEKTS